MIQKEIQDWLTFWQNARMVAVEEINAFDQVHLARKYCQCMRVVVFSNVSDLDIWRALENMRSGKYPDGKAAEGKKMQQDQDVAAAHRRSDAEPTSPTAPTVEQERRERASMFLLGWFGAIFDEDETEEMCRLLMAFVDHETPTADDNWFQRNFNSDKGQAEGSSDPTRGSRDE